MEREVGGGIGMGNTCKPMAVSFQYMTEFTTIKKKIKATLIPGLRLIPTVCIFVVRGLEVLGSELPSFP